ncbi:MAG: hypothetical protein K9H26_11820 [Prolixibacteraceae bacterium]|nr:hypothetical protein [Prolixibacteraceae bacterium]
MSRFFLCIAFCSLLAFWGIPQPGNNHFFVTGKVKVDRGVVDGTSVEVYRENALVQNLEVNRTGTFRVSVGIGYVYRFVFTNPAYYSKTIEIDTHVPPEVCSENCSFPPYQLAVLLYKKVPGVSSSDQGVARVSYNPKIDNFDAEILRQEIDLTKILDEALKETREKSKRYEKESRKVLKEKYNRHVSDGDHYFRIRQYDKAMNSYREAVLTEPAQTYPRNQVKKAFQILVAQQLEERFGKPTEDNFLTYLNYGDTQFANREYTYAYVAYSRALSVKPDDENIKQKTEAAKAEVQKLHELAIAEVNHKKQVYAARTARYNELITEADQKLKQEDIAGAKDLYAQAATQIDENSYAVLMLQTIGDIVSNDELAMKLAREREEVEKKRLNEARERAYNDAINEADALFDRRIFREALEYYQLALNIKSYELYPQKQINAINDILAGLQLSGEGYNRLLREAEKLMFDKKYREARQRYVEAHALIPDEHFALEKIKEIDKILKGLEAEEAANEQYLAEIEKADGFFNNRKYSEALDAYQAAGRLKFSEQYPKEQIKKIREILARESDEQKRLMQKKADYELALQKADNAFDLKSYSIARSLYLQALQIIPGQEYPSSQIRKIDEILRDEKDKLANEGSTLDKIDFSNLDDITREQREAAYKEAMSMGESFFRTKEWGVARFYFRKALALIPNDPPATQRLAETEQKIRGTGTNLSKYREMVEKAEEAFETGDFSVSKFYYSKALEAKPGDKIVTERLRVLEHLIQGTMNRENSREYNEAIKKGDEAFSANNYSLARFFYRKAQSLKTNDELVPKKLEMVEKAIDISKKAGSSEQFKSNMQLAEKAIEQKQYGLALGYLRKALQIQPGDENTLKQIERVEGVINDQ